jgi:hypothetical protein
MQSFSATPNCPKGELPYKFADLWPVRTRAAYEKAVRAEDFFDLLMSEPKGLDALLPRACGHDERMTFVATGRCC